MDVVVLALLAASTTFDLPPGLLQAVCKIESKYIVEAVNLDDNGSPSIGLCQVKEATARFMGYSGPMDVLQTDAYTNAFYAAKYMRYQLNRYHNDQQCSVAAYNAGRCNKDENGHIRNAMYVKKVFQAWYEGRTCSIKKHACTYR